MFLPGGKKRGESMSDDLRIGVFVCECRHNIAGMVDCEAVRTHAVCRLWWLPAVTMPIATILRYRRRYHECK
jgi:hypothetical protein